MADAGALYADGRGRIAGLVRDLDDEVAAGPVPTCPDWRVKDVLAHVVGVCADVLAGNLVGVASDPWTEAQVAPRRKHPVGEMLQEWEELAPQVEAMTGMFPERMAEQLVLDLTTHEHDLRTALGHPGERDSDGVRTGATFLVEVALQNAFREMGLAPLRICAGGREWTVGGDDAGVTLEVSSFELMRAFTGRRSAEQIRSLAWTGNPLPYLPAFSFGPFAMSSVDIEE